MADAETERKILRLLRRKDFHGAVEFVKKSKISHFWGVSIGNRKSLDCSGDLQILEILFEKTPKLLRSAPDEYLAPARLVAGLCHLLGERRSKTVKVADVFTPGTGILASWLPNVLLGHAYHLVNIESYLKLSRPPGLRIRSINDEMVCEHCKQMHDQTFPLLKTPEIPLEACTSAYGCRCYTQPFVG